MRFVYFVLLLIFNVTFSFSSNVINLSNNTIPGTPKNVSNNSSMVQPSVVPGYAAEGGPITVKEKEPNSSNNSVTEKVKVFPGFLGNLRKLSLQLELPCPLTTNVVIFWNS